MKFDRACYERKSLGENLTAVMRTRGRVGETGLVREKRVGDVKASLETLIRKRNDRLWGSGQGERGPWIEKTGSYVLTTLERGVIRDN